MNTSETISKEIKSNQKKINTLTTRIKTSHNDLLELIRIQTTYFNLYRENGKNNSDLSKVLDKPTGETIDTVKNYRYITNRGVIDKKALELAEILKVSKSKDNTKKSTVSKKKSNLLRAATLIGNLKEIMVDTNSDDQKMIASLLSDINK